MKNTLFPLSKWYTQTFFIKCFKNKKFEPLVDFFNDENPYLYKNTMLLLCINYLEEKQVYDILSNVTIIITNKQVTTNKDHQEMFDKIKEKFPNMFKSEENINQNKYLSIYKDDIYLSKKLTIELLENQLDFELSCFKNSKEVLTFMDIYKPLIDKIDQESLNSIITHKKNELKQWLILFYIYQNRIYELLRFDPFFFSDEKLFKRGRFFFYFFKFCNQESIEKITNLPEVFEHILSVTADNYLITDKYMFAFFIKSLYSKYYLDIEVKLELTKYLIKYTISYFAAIYSNINDVFKRMEELMSLVPLEIIYKMISFSGPLYELSYFLIHYVKMTEHKSLSEMIENPSTSFDYAIKNLIQNDSENKLAKYIMTKFISKS